MTLRPAWQYSQTIGPVFLAVSLVTIWLLTPGALAQQSRACTDCKPLKPADPVRCEKLESQLARPGQFVSRGQAQLDRYEPVMAEFMEKLCYRAWPHDATARDTGPYTATLANGQLKSQAYNQHAVSRLVFAADVRVDGSEPAGR
jgi:hypothetical protein